MAHTLSALKRHRQSLRRGARNRARITAARTAVRQARESIAGGNREEAEAAINKAASVLDRAAQKGTLHPNNASRRKSRLMRMLHRAEAPVEEAPKKRRATKATGSRAKKK
ncbi:MAG: 30S ribosomal protein S20 [Dehalococcoidia bacterium]